VSRALPHEASWYLLESHNEDIRRKSGRLPRADTAIVLVRRLYLVVPAMSPLEDLKTHFLVDGHIRSHPYMRAERIPHSQPGVCSTPQMLWFLKTCQDPLVRCLKVYMDVHKAAS
jgi:hypothetical protein